MGYIYSLNCPITKEPKYIGQTIKSLEKRLQWHQYIYSNSNKREKWILSLRNKGLIPIIEEIDNVENNDLDFWEKHYISLYKSWGFVLKNGTFGGRGVVSDLLMKNKITEGLSKPEVRIKLSNSKLGELNPSKQKKTRDKLKKAWENRIIKQIDQYSLDGNFIKTWDRQTIAALELNISKDCICKCLKEKLSHAGGFIWKYKKDENKVIAIKGTLKINSIGKMYINKRQKRKETSIIKAVKNNPNKRRVLQFTKEGMLIKEYSSMAEAARAVNTNQVNIRRVCIHYKNAKTAKGFRWEFKDNNLKLINHDNT